MAAGPVGLMLSTLILTAASSRAGFDPFEQNKKLKEQLDLFNEKIKKLKDEEKSLIKKVKANWETRSKDMSSAKDEKDGLQEGVEKLKTEYKEKEHCLQDWVDAHSKMKESVMKGLAGSALVKTNSSVQPLRFEKFNLVLRNPPTSTAMNRNGWSASAGLRRSTRFRPIHLVADARTMKEQVSENLAHQDDRMQSTKNEALEPEIAAVHTRVTPIHMTTGAQTLEDQNAERMEIPSPTHMAAGAQTLQDQDAEKMQVFKEIMKDRDVEKMKVLDEEEREEEDEEEVLEQDDGFEPSHMAAGPQTLQDQDDDASGWIEVPDEEMDEAEASGMDDAREKIEQGNGRHPEVANHTSGAREGLPEEVKLDPAVADGIMEAAGSSEAGKPMPPQNPVRLRGNAPASTGMAVGTRTVQDQDLETSDWIEAPDEEMDEVEASGVDDADENQPPQEWAEANMQAYREGMSENGIDHLDPATADGIMEAAGASEAVKPTQAARKTLAEDVNLAPAAAEGITQTAGTSEVVKPKTPHNPVDLRGPAAPTPKGFRPIHIGSRGRETKTEARQGEVGDIEKLAHQDERMRVIEDTKVPDSEIASVFHMAAGARAVVQEKGADKMKMMKENEVLTQALDLARSDAQRLYLTNQKYAATLSAADTRTEHWGELLKRMKGTFKAQEDLLKAQIAQLDAKCKEVDQLKGVPGKIKENFDDLKKKEQAVLGDIPLAPEKDDCRIKRIKKRKDCKSYYKKTNIGKGSPDSKARQKECQEFCKRKGSYRFSVGWKGGCRCCKRKKDGGAKWKKRKNKKVTSYRAIDCR